MQHSELENDLFPRLARECLFAGRRTDGILDCRMRREYNQTGVHNHIKPPNLLRAVCRRNDLLLRKLQRVS